MRHGSCWQCEFSLRERWLFSPNLAYYSFSINLTKLLSDCELSGKVELSATKEWNGIWLTPYIRIVTRQLTPDSNSISNLLLTPIALAMIRALRMECQRDIREWSNKTPIHLLGSALTTYFPYYGSTAFSYFLTLLGFITCCFLSTTYGFYYLLFPSANTSGPS